MRTTVEPEIDERSGEAREKLYHVIILNDDEHSFDYVVGATSLVIDRLGAKQSWVDFRRRCHGILV